MNIRRVSTMLDYRLYRQYDGCPFSLSNYSIQHWFFVYLRQLRLSYAQYVFKKTAQTNCPSTGQ